MSEIARFLKTGGSRMAICFEGNGEKIKYKK
jgi:hypothetical protein